MGSRSPIAIEELPHAPGRLPLLGDLTSVDRKRPTQHELHLAHDLGLGPIFQRKIFRSRLVIVSGARLAAQCLDEAHWARALVGPGASLRRVTAHGLFTARSSDPLWGRARRILGPGFSQAAMRAYHHAMQTVADDLIIEWTAERGPIDTHSAMTRATLEVIGRAGFSRDLGLFKSGPGSSESRMFVNALAATLQWASEATNDLPVIGGVRNRLRESNVRRDIQTLHRYVDAMIAERKARPTDDDDLLNLMLTTADPDTGEQLPAENIRDQVLTFLVAGHETTAALLEVALHYLATDSHLQAELREEIQRRSGTDYEAVAGMRLIRQVINECLRLWPPVPGFFRLARTDQDLGGYRIPAGRAVFVLALAAQRDTEVWGPKAVEFDPHRFDPPRLREYPDRFLQPWGTGPRACIGRAFATHEATLLLARILDEFVLSSADGPMVMQERGTLRPKPFQLSAIRRT
ncbi:cytochrome P450 [Nocardia arthritidis]|uniref:Cytochrome P450 n=1 Tax=Nocardia arthritidis TaxID=228602 RepID=A0A6G9Y6R8_9NOCA|nr:cytochrome P450 [Nocardia arthritidis]QIS08777.1 cytochrome P450 [Nocardia arthritidis]